MPKSKHMKREEAWQRQQERDKRSANDQLDLISKRRGESKKEKTKLLPK